MLKKFFVYIDDGKDVFRLAVPAKDAKDAKKWAEGNGEIIKVKEVTDEYPIDIYKVQAALNEYGFGRTEQDFIIRALSRIGIA